MALVLQGFQLTVTLLGEANTTRQKTFELIADSGAADDAAAMTTALADAQNLITTMSPTTAAEIVDWRLSAVYEEDTAIAVPADADLYREALYSVGVNPTGTKKAPLTIFAPADVLYDSDDEATGSLDNGDLALASFLDNFETGRFRISDGEQILSNPAVRASRLRSVSSGKSFR
jgi:hypothetical protein